MALVTDIRAARSHAAVSQIAAEAAPVAVEVTWASPEAKLWVGSRRGEYAGMIEYTQGHFVVSGPTGRRLGSCSDLAQAMAVAEQGARHSRLSETLLSNVALASAVMALSVAGVSLSMIAA